MKKGINKLNIQQLVDEILVLEYIWWFVPTVGNGGFVREKRRNWYDVCICRVIRLEYTVLGFDLHIRVY